MNKILVLGIGNLLMGDEGIGVHIVRHIENNHNLKDVDIVDGGTGGFHLLEYFQLYPKIILVDATLDNMPLGTIQMIKPKYSSDYPPTLTAHDIGLKDLIDSLYLLKIQPEIFILTISITNVEMVGDKLSKEIQQIIPEAVKLILQKITELRSEVDH